MPVIPRDPRLVRPKTPSIHSTCCCARLLCHTCRRGVSVGVYTCVDRPHDNAFLRPNVCTAGKTSRLASLGMAPLYGPPFDIVCVERTCSLPIRHVNLGRPRRATNHPPPRELESQDDVLNCLLRPVAAPLQQPVRKSHPSCTLYPQDGPRVR
jgi:hypothetical protein